MQKLKSLFGDTNKPNCRHTNSGEVKKVTTYKTKILFIQFYYPGWQKVTSLQVCNVSNKKGGNKDERTALKKPS